MTGGKNPEGLIVVALLGLVVAILLPMFVRGDVARRRAVTTANLEQLVEALRDHERRLGLFPEAGTIGELAAQLDRKGLPLMDGWGREIRYECIERRNETEECVVAAVGSAGRDRAWEENSFALENTSAQSDDPEADVVLVVRGASRDRRGG